MRIVGALFGVGLVLLKYWPERLKRYLPVYWYLATLYALPFFFVFMVFANEGSSVWLMSTMASVFIAALVLDWANFVIQYVIGGLLAFVVCWAVYGAPNGLPIIAEHLPIYLFSIVGAVAFRYAKELVNESKRGMYFKIGATIAHELRSPLLAIKMYLDSAVRWVSVMEADQSKCPGTPRSNMAKMMSSIKAASKQVEDSFTIIDMMLMNVNHRAQQLSDVGVHQASYCMEKAVEGLPYKSSSQRKMVRWESVDDFQFEGSALLVIHVLYNLIKNAIFYADAADRPEGGAISPRGRARQIIPICVEIRPIFQVPRRSEWNL